MEVAIRLIGERGIYGTRVEDITERSDLGKGAFYNYFESKDHLLAELVAQGVALLHERYLADLTPRSSAAKRVAAVIAAHAAFFADHPAYVVLFHQTRGLTTIRPGEHEVLTTVFREYLRRTGEVIVPRDDPGRPGEDAQIDLAAVILGAIAGYRSFRIAAGLDVRSAVVADVLGAGMPAALTSYRRTRRRRAARRRARRSSNRPS